MIDLATVPFPVSYRELWLPPSINGNATLPSSVRDGKLLTLSGARQGTTTDGVHFTGGATSYAQIVAEAGFNNKTKFVFFARFKFDQTFQTGVATQWLYNKTLVNEWLKIYFDTADGKLTFSQGDGAGGELFTLKSATQTVWNAGQWYNICCTLTDAAGGAQKLEVGGIVMGNGVAAARNTPNGGDSYIGNQSAPGAAGFIGTISLVMADSTALTSDQLTFLVNGFAAFTPVYFLPMDTGRGVTLTNRGSGGNNGTIQAANTWAYGQVQQPCLSLDSINDSATTPATVNISGDLTFAWVGKMKSTYNGLPVAPSRGSFFFMSDAPNNNYLWFLFNQGAGSSFEFFTRGGGGAAASVVITQTTNIDDYMVFIGTVSSVTSLYLNGTLAGSAAGPTARNSLVTAYIGREDGASRFDISKPLFIGLMDGAMNAKQVLAYSRWLRDSFNLPVNM